MFRLSNEKFLACFRRYVRKWPHNGMRPARDTAPLIYL